MELRLFVVRMRHKGHYMPLLRLEDGHVLATLSAVVLALCEGRTGLAISGVFGAGKTRSAAALLAGLLVFDPNLQLTKENIAAHAVAEHLVSLQMPDHIQDKMGRLVGYYEQNRKGSYTPLDILPSNRNQVIRQKSLLIGFGGGFLQECSQQFSPVADWMGSVDLCLEDEGTTIREHGRRAQLLELRYLFGGVVWRPQANARWTEKEQRIEVISEETHQAPAGPALPNSVYSST